MARVTTAGGLAVCGALGGVLAAALVAPIVAGAGVASNTAAGTVTKLPPPPREDPLPEVTRLVDRNGRQFAQFYSQNRQSVTIDQVSKPMREAIVAIEDARFYEHAGLDVRGTIRALIANTQAGGIRQGGSSLTQQLVKNILVNRAESEKERDSAQVRSIRRKFTEMRYALALEEKYSKDQILERYLNIAYFGAGAFGVQAAARRFFGVSAKDLTLGQAAALAGAVRTPYSTDPARGEAQREKLQQRRDLVLDRMAELGEITPAEAAAAKSQALGLNMRAEPGGCAESEYPYFCVYVQHEILANPAFGHSRADRERRLQRGGLTLKTTLDPVAQKAADKAIEARVAAEDTEVAAEAMVEPGTGAIRALAASKRYGSNPGGKVIGPNTTFNLAADTAHGGGMGFQAGSTFKIFTLATALAKGWKFGQGFDTPGVFVPSEGFTDCAGKPVNDPSAKIYNASGEGKGGPYSLELGTWKSSNIFFMMLEREVGLCDVIRTAKALGIQRADGGKLSEVPTFTLGVNEMDPLTVAAAVATFGARGKYCKPIAITEIVERDGRRVEIPPACSATIDPAVADAVNDVLSGVFTQGTMKGQSIGRPAAGKTGTNNNYTSAWFAGYTPNLAAAVSVGDIRGSYKYPLNGVRIGDQTYGSVQGASLPGPIWVDSMQGALRDTPATEFTPPDMGRFGGGFTPGLREAMEAERGRRGDVEYEYWYEDENGNLYPEDDYYRGDPRDDYYRGNARADGEGRRRRD
ncbi:transglycosylase domain-containing protein [Herbidospora sp. NBRC 101105]|uniref:transglycosylase domain-containing protein n=1 Tax=Herbidospora sp. NBRC 101105 TaxID=3032195 RepID=UPI0024A5404F|nr:transglycosylase domain-containing protein [Herbidospora sp. NBRC 101105]GLX92758.1 penicillin-binding protein [Herbidospora sp. NBRC 101105]